MKFLFFILTCNLSIAQTFCEYQIIPRVDKINIQGLMFEKKENYIDSIKYNSFFICQQTGVKIYCNIDENGKKNGRAIILDKEDNLIACGQFKSNRKNGWWIDRGIYCYKFRRDKIINIKHIIL